jgi:TRAP-type C4-dicarboxylate transport system permease small subunit
MGRAEKVLDIVIWLLVISGMMWFAYGCYELIDLFFIRG